MREPLTILDATEDGIVVVPTYAAGDRHPVAYHPDDARTWYTRREPCERAADDERNSRVPRTRATRSAPLLPAGPPGC